MINMYNSFVDWLNRPMDIWGFLFFIWVIVINGFHWILMWCAPLIAPFDSSYFDFWLDIFVNIEKGEKRKRSILLVVFFLPSFVAGLLTILPFYLIVFGGFAIILKLGEWFR